MSDSFEERLKALEEAKKQIINDSFTAAQKEIEDDLRKELEQLKQSADKES